MSDWKQLDLFQREANTLKELQHPGIPQYVADFEEDTEKDRGYFLVQASLLHRYKQACSPDQTCLLKAANMLVL